MSSHVNPYNLSPIIQVVTWLLLATDLLAVVLRGANRLFTSQTVGLDDLSILIAFTLGVGQSVTYLSPQGHAWGQSVNSLSNGEIEDALKARLAGTILHVLCLLFSKLSVLALLGRLCGTRERRFNIIIAAIATTAAMAGVVIGIGAQCRPSQSRYVPDSKCQNKNGLVYAEIALNITTEVMITVLPVWIVAPLQMPLHRRASILLWFSARFLVIAAAATQIAYVKSILKPDFTLTSFSFIIATQCVQTLSIVTACVPLWKKLMQSLESGFLRVDDQRRRGQTSMSELSVPKSPTKMSEATQSSAYA